MFPIAANRSDEENTTPYSDDVFSTTLYTDNGSTQTITNGIDLAGKGGLVWIKRRSAAQAHLLYDTARGNNYTLYSDSTAAQNGAGYIWSPTSFGYTNGTNGTIGETYASWTFRKAAKFFDIVTYTGDGVALRRISHSLGVTPGMVIIKRTNAASNWWTAARKDSLNWAVSNGDGTIFGLNSTDAATNSNYMYPSPYSPAGPTDFCPDGVVPMVNFGSQAQISNTAGATYVAYLFAHDTSSTGIIQCGSFTTDGSGNATVNLGWEPQFVLTKLSTGEGNWRILDSMRGLNMTQVVNLNPNLSNAEFVNNQNYFNPTATGFQDKNLHGPNQTVIYMAIRRPNKPPTSGTQVYNAIARTGTSAAATVTGVGFAPDLDITQTRTGGSAYAWLFDKLRGVNKALVSQLTNAEITRTDELMSFNMDGVTLGVDAGGDVNDSYKTYINHFFKRAPGFFDVVCYTGDGTSSRTIPASMDTRRNAMIIIKPRDTANYFNDWKVYHLTGDGVGWESFLFLNKSDSMSFNNLNGGIAQYGYVPNSFRVVDIQGVENVNQTGIKYVAYIFGTLAGISKLGRYIGNGSSLNIECGFASGARFVLIKRHDSAGDWYVWDTARGIVTGNDPHLSLNTSAAEVTADDSIDPYSAGFTVNQVAATNINVTSATYIFLAIA